MAVNNTLFTVFMPEMVDGEGGKRGGMDGRREEGRWRQQSGVTSLRTE